MKFFFGLYEFFVVCVKFGSGEFAFNAETPWNFVIVF